MSLLAGFSIGVVVASILWYKYGDWRFHRDFVEQKKVHEYIEELRRKKASESKEDRH